MVLILIFPEIPRVLVLMKNRESESLSLSTMVLIKNECRSQEKRVIGVIDRTQGKSDGKVIFGRGAQ